MTLSLPDVRLGAQRPRVHSAPPFRSSAGTEAVEVAAQLGLFLDPWQQWVLERSLGEKPDGRWAAFQVCLLCPRQNGKGSILEARELAGLFLFGEKKITHSAHEAKTAKDHFERMESLLRDAGYGDDLVTYRRSTTEVSILVRETGCKLQFYTRTNDGGRGLVGDVVVLDEAYALTRDQMAALMPTMSARSVSGNPQMWFTSSAGFDHSEVLAGKKAQGEKGSDRLAYFDWSANPDFDLTDRDAWAQANPGLGLRISEEFIADELVDLGAERFARERLGWWNESGADEIFGSGKWAQCAAGDEGLPTGLKMAGLAVAVSWDLSRAAVEAASVDGERAVVQSLDAGAGTDWLPDRLRELQAQHRIPVVLDERGPAARLLPELRKARIRVETLKTGQICDAFDEFFTRVVEGRLVHGGFPELDAAVNGATTRPVGDRRTWGRRLSSADISPVEAATLAVYWATRPKTPPPPPVVERVSDDSEPVSGDLASVSF